MLSPIFVGSRCNVTNDDEELDASAPVKALIALDVTVVELVVEAVVLVDDGIIIYPR